MNERDGTDRDARRRQLALFRHAIIGELDIEKLPRGERSARITELAGRTYELPEGSTRPFRARTLWAWWSAYQRHGLEGLLPKARADRGALRALTPTLRPRRSGFGKKFPHARPPR